MKKTVLLGIVISFMLVVLVGCSGDDFFTHLEEDYVALRIIEAEQMLISFGVPYEAIAHMTGAQKITVFEKIEIREDEPEFSSFSIVNFANVSIGDACNDY